MAYDDFEISNQDGKPDGLFEFRLDTLYWRYTSADEDIPFGLDEHGDPIIWKAGAISRGGIVQGSGTQNDFELTLPANLEIVGLFDAMPPSSKLYLTVRALHEGDDEAPINWLGTVANIARKTPAEATAVCRNLVATFERSGLRLYWSRQCPHALYDEGCKVNKADHRLERTVDTVDGDRFTVTAAAVLSARSFSGGFIEWDRGNGSMERRAIHMAESDTTFSILGSTWGMEPGMTISMYPGCPRTTEACEEGFDNLLNYGGFPHLPGQSPFQGTQVF